MIHLAHAIVGGIGDVKISGRVDRDTRRVVELRGGGRAVVAAVASGSAAGHGRDYPRGKVHFADTIVAGIGDEEVTRGVYGDICGAVEPGGGGLAAVAAIAGNSVAGDGGDHARGGVDFADAVVAGIGDKDIAGGVHGNPLRQIERGGGGRTVVAAVAGAGRGGDQPGGVVDFANPVVRGVGEIQIARRVQGNAHRAVHYGGGGRTVIAVVAGRSIAGHGGDDPRSGIDFADAIIPGIGDVDVP